MMCTIFVKLYRIERPAEPRPCTLHSLYHISTDREIEREQRKLHATSV